MAGPDVLAGAADVVAGGDLACDGDDAVADLRDESSLTLETGGDLFFAFEEAPTGIGEVAGIVVAMIVLLIAFGSFVAMGLPIGMALFGLVIGATSMKMVTYLVDIPAWAPQLAAMVERVGTTGVADGLWMDGKGRLFVTSPEDDALKLRTMDGTMTTLVQDKRLRWPDSLAEGPDGAIYVTSSHIQDMAQFHEKGSTRTQPYALWKLQPPR